jgi:glycosyltransferase involved in cell wall biosynthesis
MANPLVTFAVFGYNQGGFIREAVEGALSQTYSPLEVILVDDCSTDDTFSIMEEVVAKYRGGHQTRLHRASTNRGLSAQIDHVVENAGGEWIVVAAGDDISLPSRVAEHIEIAEQHSRAFSSFLAPAPFGDSATARVPVVYNRVVRFPESLKASGGGVLGATQAFRKSIWNVFGDLGPGIIAEDWVIPFRASLLGSVVWSDRQGVRYRVHSSSCTATNWSRPSDTVVNAKQLRLECNALTAFQRDLRRAAERSLVPASDAEEGLRWLENAIRSNQLILDCSQVNNLTAWLAAAGRLLTSRTFVVGNFKRRLDLVLRTLRGRLFRGS